MLISVEGSLAEANCSSSNIVPVEKIQVVEFVLLCNSKGGTRSGQPNNIEMLH